MRNISFALTTPMIQCRTKTVTRRLGWTFLKPGDLLQPIAKGQGLKKGERIEKIGGPVRVVSVRREPLWAIRKAGYGSYETDREGFPFMTGYEFEAMFCQTHRCTPDTYITRIEFSYVDTAHEAPQVITAVDPQV